MKKVTINISYDEEKLSALKLYLDKKDVNVEDELKNYIDKLYIKSVPIGVREYIEIRSGKATDESKIKKQSTLKINSEVANNG